jgi:hypothetical protein
LSTTRQKPLHLAHLEKIYFNQKQKRRFINMKRKILSVLLTVAMLMTMTAFGAMTVSAEEPTGLAIVGEATRSVTVGATISLAVTLDPAGADLDYGEGFEIEWESNNDNVDVDGDGLTATVEGETAGSSIVTATLIDLDDDSTVASVTFTITVNAIPVVGAPTVEWNRITETFSADGAVLYAVVRGTAPDALARARWFPLSGDLNVTRIVPRRAGRNAYVAFRPAATALSGVTIAGETTPGLTIQQSDAATGTFVVTIAPRGDAPARGAITWGATGTFNGLSDTGTYAIMVGRAGTNGWTYLNTGAITQHNFPMGASAEVRPIPATATASGPINAAMTITPASNAARVRIPAVPRAPGAPRIRTGTGAVSIPGTQQFMFVSAADRATFDMTTFTAATDWTTGTDVTLTAAHVGQYLITRLAPDAGRNRPASFPRATLIIADMIPATTTTTAAAPTP